MSGDVLAGWAKFSASASRDREWMLSERIFELKANMNDETVKSALDLIDAVTHADRQNIAARLDDTKRCGPQSTRA